MSSPQYLINSESRTFIRQYSDSYTKYDFYACTIADTLSQDNGEVVASYYPDFKYDGRFVESATIVSHGSRPTINIVGRIPRNFNSKIYQLTKDKIPANIQLHFGRCYNPTIFNDFDEAVILEDVRIVSYNTDRLGSLGRDENATINETVSVSVGHWYTIHKLAYSNIGAKIIADGFVPLSMDILDCDQCNNYSTEYCTIFVLARADFNPTTIPFRIYITENNGRTWRYVILPDEVYDQTIVAAQFSTISVFEDYVYLHLQATTGLSAETRIFSMATRDILRNDGIWSTNAVNGPNDKLPSSDRIIKFKNRLYAPYVESLTPDSSYLSRIVDFGTFVSNNYTVSYVPKTNAIYDIIEYHDTPLYLYNYKDQILFSGLYIGIPELDNDPRKLYIAYTKDGHNWNEVPIIVDGVQEFVFDPAHVHIAPLTDKHWIVTVQIEGESNVAYCTLNGGKTWKSIPVAFKDERFLATYIPTESIMFSDKNRSYDGGITSVPLPDNNSDIDYSTDIGGFGLTGNSYGKAMGCKNNPNQMFTYGNTGVFLFS
jgi:hypothetical protein